MKTKALLMTIAMMSATLAGCTGSDGVAEIDDETLQQLFDDNIQDFMNNTSVTVNQEIHYHNNTTVNQDIHYHNNTTVNEGSDVTENNFQTDYTNYTLGQLGNSSNGAGETLFVMHMEFAAEDLAPDLVPRVDIDPRTLTYSYTKNFTGYVWVETGDGNNSSGYYQEADIPITHQVPCSIFYTFENSYDNNSGMNNFIFWDYKWAYYDYFEQTYGSDSSGHSEMRGYDYYQAGQESEEICNPQWNPWLAENLVVNIGNITIPQGYMISLSVTEYLHVWGETPSPVANGSNISNEGGSISALYYDDYSSYDFMIFTKESGGISANSVASYGGWEDLTLEMDLRMGYFWETTDVTITVLYSFTPVIPVQ
mgnify:CR=1 FL=1